MGLTRDKPRGPSKEQRYEAAYEAAKARAAGKQRKVVHVYDCPIEQVNGIYRSTHMTHGNRHSFSKDGGWKRGGVTIEFVRKQTVGALALREKLGCWNIIGTGFHEDGAYSMGRQGIQWVPAAKPKPSRRVGVTLYYHRYPLYQCVDRVCGGCEDHNCNPEFKKHKAAAPQMPPETGWTRIFSRGRLEGCVDISIQRFALYETKQTCKCIPMGFRSGKHYELLRSLGKSSKKQIIYHFTNDEGRDGHIEFGGEYYRFAELKHLISRRCWQEFFVPCYTEYTTIEHHKGPKYWALFREHSMQVCPCPWQESDGSAARAEEVLKAVAGLPREVARVLMAYCQPV